MIGYLKEVIDLTASIAQVGQLKSPAEVNDHLLAGLHGD